MLNSVTINGYRAFRKLDITGLTRVNLFVGKNNTGKTSLLEAIELLVLQTPWALFRSPIRRDENFLLGTDDDRPVGRRELDLSHLFYGHRLEGAWFSISAVPRSASVVCRVIEATGEPGQGPVQTRLPDFESVGPSLAISFESSLTKSPVLIPIQVSGAVSLDTRRRLQGQPLESGPVANFLRPETTDTTRLMALWDSVVLTPEEQRVVEALQIIEPSIERIAFLGDDRRYYRSIFLKLTGSDQRLPIGSVGDGLRRLLALSLNLIPARGGYLFVDEIDTGLHFTVMADMWRLVIATARRLDVQVFATTHSLDCVSALAQVTERPDIPEADVSLHRIERDSDKTIQYSPDELITAARHHLEVR